MQRPLRLLLHRLRCQLAIDFFEWDWDMLSRVKFVTTLILLSLPISASSEDLSNASVALSRRMYDATFDYGTIDEKLGISLGIAVLERSYSIGSTIGIVTSLKNWKLEETMMFYQDRLTIKIVDSMGRPANLQPVLNHVESTDRKIGSMSPGHRSIQYHGYIATSPGIYRVTVTQPIRSQDGSMILTTLVTPTASFTVVR